MKKQPFISLLKPLAKGNTIGQLFRPYKDIVAAVMGELYKSVPVK